MKKYKQTLPEGLKRYYTKEAGEWGSIIDSLMSEDKAKLALSLMYGEPLYTQGELDKAREEVFTEDERYHLVNLLEGGLRITDSISQSEIFKSILSKLRQ